MRNNNKEKDDMYNPNNRLYNSPKFKVHGHARRELKKELSLLKSAVKGYWTYHNIDKDMASIYKGFVMSDEDAKEIYDKYVLEVKDIEDRLAVPFIQRYREERLKKLLNNEWSKEI